MDEQQFCFVCAMNNMKGDERRKKKAEAASALKLVDCWANWVDFQDEEQFGDKV